MTKVRTFVRIIRLQTVLRGKVGDKERQIKLARMVCISSMKKKTG